MWAESPAPPAGLACLEPDGGGQETELKPGLNIKQPGGKSAQLLLIGCFHYRSLECFPA